MLTKKDFPRVYPINVKGNTLPGMPVCNENHVVHRKSKKYKENPEISELMGQGVSFTQMRNTWDEIVYVPIEDTAWDQG